MTIESQVDSTKSSLTIKVKGRFDFNSHQDFRDAYEQLSNPAEHVLVDMKEASYLDSSALGMLLLLRDYAGGDDADVVLSNCNSDVRKILNISNFELLFTIQ